MKHDNQTDLSPCPKCGSTPVLETGHYGREPFRIVCRDCIDGDDGVEIAVDAFGCSRDAARAAWAAQVAEESRPPEVETAVGERMWFLRVSPNLCDGQHATYAGPGGATIAQLSEWLESWWEDDCEEGETITLQVVRMTQAEYDAIPEC